MKMKVILVIVVMAVFAAPAFAQPAEPYRLAFVTLPVYQATETDIGVYNQWMQDEADAAGIGVGSGLGDGDTSWFVIGSTALVDARDNTGTNPSSTGVPIYLTDMTTKVADDNADLWDGTVDNIINTRADGSVTTGHLWVFSGTKRDGTAADNTGSNFGPFGQVGGNIQQGKGFLTDAWICPVDGDWVGDPPETSLPIYAMSEIIPEPATMCLLGLGGLVMLRRRR